MQQQDEAQKNGSHEDEVEGEESRHQAEATTPCASVLHDAKALPEECNICFCAYQEQEQRPRTLPCGHTLCSPCITSLLNDGRITCPTCLTRQSATDATHFPVNYALENMIRRFRTLQTKRTNLVMAGKTKQNEDAILGRKLQSIIRDQQESLEELEGTVQLELNQLEQYCDRLTLSLTRHNHVLEELDKVTQQHHVAVDQLTEERLKVKTFMGKGRRDKKDLKIAQDQLSSVTSALEVYLVIDAADSSAAVVEEWLKHSKERFPNGAVYNTSCKILEGSEAALQVALEDGNTAEFITSGHSLGTILDVLEKIHKKSDKHVKNCIKKKFTFMNTEGNYFPSAIEDFNKSQSPTQFGFKFGNNDSKIGTLSSKFKAPSTPSFLSTSSHQLFPELAAPKTTKQESVQLPGTSTTTTATTTTTTTTTTSTFATTTSLAGFSFSLGK